MPGLDETENEYRWRLQDPGLFQKDSFRRKNITSGVSLIVGRKKGKTTTEAQAIRFDKDKFSKSEALKWVKDHKDKFSTEDGEEYAIENYALPETVDIKNVEIFSSAYNPKGHKYTDKMLDEIVTGFYETKNEIKPYLEFGHNREQKTEMPTIGWIENLKKKGKKLICDFVKVPKKVYELVKAGAYRRVSAEIFWNITISKKKYNRLLKSVSLLGATTPACEDLNDVISLYADEELYESDSEVQEYEFEIVENAIKEDKLSMEKIRKLLKQLMIERDNIWKNRHDVAEAERAEVEMKAKEVSAKIAVLEDKMKELIKEKGLYYKEEVSEDMGREQELEAQVKKYQDEKEAAEKKTEEEKKAKEEAEKKAEEEKQAKEKLEKEKEEKKVEETKTETHAMVDKLIEEKHLLPADKDAISSIIIDSESATEVKKYKFGEKNEEKSVKEILQTVIERYTVDIETDGESETGKNSKDKDNSALAEKAEKYAKDNKISYREALSKVSEEESK